MDFYSWLFDKKVKGVNVSIDISIGDYWQLAQPVLRENELQRPRVAAKGKPYQLLQRDLIEGCVMPPIIVALKRNAQANIDEVLAGLRNGVIPNAERDLLAAEIERAFNSREVLILDGLQRTYTIGDCIAQLREERPGQLDTFLARKIRLEVYVGLNKTGILYRMLTLNTGQTPMSFRHQIEILYHDFLDPGRLPAGLAVVREADARRARGAGKYKYADVVDMFYAYSTGRPESIDKQNLVNKLGELEFLEEYDNVNSDLTSLLVVYNRFVRHIESIANDWEFDLGELRSVFPEAVVDRPFGTDVASLFERVQAMTAFGAEAKRLIRQKQVGSLEELSALLTRSLFSDAPSLALNELVLMLDEVAKKATKIGTAQREIFQYSFRSLFNSDSPTFLDLSTSWREGQRKFESLN
ncbi:hypothetical protein [Lysobacter solisilvae (ex Woo and Kim 2020)]|uniref:Uncharacterized protein n=1 Tax=Agrilutibacter terrestris TaxID=2865112 RepID=A0A7H0FWU2_9GAMM|nr:hypothetical protein [Lysobacter terrestris]QNP40508.1 hypothetical protein H8B22_13720 [Lysobacter terrestris]